MSLAEFDWPFQIALDKNNRWVKMSTCIPGMNWLKATTKVCHRAKADRPKMPDWSSVR